ncbi:hypothetical protein ABZT34_26265 [Streptomyces sp. NPDC005329]|uniref:beta-xylosidase family glycoside hydrolase n=1 Tax=Streptomyces sp. NPDC005329 TaxID=3157034 RepID=UPI0033B53799
MLAQRLTEHRSTVQVTLQARPSTFTQATGLILRYDAEAYLSLDLTWGAPGPNRSAVNSGAVRDERCSVRWSATRTVRGRLRSWTSTRMRRSRWVSRSRRRRRTRRRVSGTYATGYALRSVRRWTSAG